MDRSGNFEDIPLTAKDDAKAKSAKDGSATGSATDSKVDSKGTGGKTVPRQINTNLAGKGKNDKSFEDDENRALLSHGNTPMNSKSPAVE